MKNILIVEDDPIIQRIYQNKFQVEGYQVLTLGDGGAAVESLRQATPDLVLLDLMLLGMNGVEVLKFIRAHEPTRRIPVIVFTNAYLSNLVQAAWKAGASKCIVKSDCTPKLLVELVKSSLAAASILAGDTRPDAIDARTGDADLEDNFLAGRKHAFLKSVPGLIQELRERFKAFSRNPDAVARSAQLLELFRLVHSLTGNAGFVGLRQAARFSGALEAFLKVLHEKEDRLNASVLRTVANAIDFLGDLLLQPARREMEWADAFRVLVLDDDLISRRTLVNALQKVHIRPIVVSSSAAALGLLEENTFDLIFLDVEMPGQNGYEVCECLRAMPSNRQTPVVFVSGLNAFEHRARASLCGGNDVIAKPFLALELAVKALTWLLRPAASEPAPSPAAPSAAPASQAAESAPPPNPETRSTGDRPLPSLNESKNENSVDRR
ncbi:MAG: response regulator [Verrucomicrobiota bacterium]